MKHGRIIFLVNLLQDVNIVRPLAYLSASKLGRRPEFFASSAFFKRDKSGIWETELKDLVRSSGGTLYIYDDLTSAVHALSGGSGALISASESDLGAHRLTHEVFRAAPAGYTKITLQHGYECVGFLHNRAHNAAHGLTVGSAADIIVGWRPAHLQTALPLASRDRYVCAGPTVAISVAGTKATPTRQLEGLICENLHSARFAHQDELRDVFLEALSGFNDALQKLDTHAALRPHPAGQFTQRGTPSPLSNLTLANDPIYRTALDVFRYAISPPSSMLVDLVLAGVPTAVWRDSAGDMSTSHYDGLTHVTTGEDWIQFRQNALSTPEMFIHRQKQFIKHTEILVDQEEVTNRYLSLLSGARLTTSATKKPSRKILFIANGFLPTLDIYFLEPLRNTTDGLEFDLITLFEPEISKMTGTQEDCCPLLSDYLDEHKPVAIIFCRYSGCGVDQVLLEARERGIPTIFHIDDDLLNVPAEIGIAKQKFHNAPERLETVSTLLRTTDIVYCSTRSLADRFIELGYDRQYYVGHIQASGPIAVRAELRPTRTIGYMGFDHAHDLEMVLPAIIIVLDAHPEVRFEIMGSIPKPAALDRFGDRVAVRPPIRDFGLFRAAFAETRWDVGICPLATTEFNRMKANIKWWEYSVIGAAVVASRHTLYDDCCADECGMLASDLSEWVEALELLCVDPQHRYDLVVNAQIKVETVNSHEQMTAQALEAVRKARQALAQKALDNPTGLTKLSV